MGSVSFFLVSVPNRHSCDADSLQVGNLETLIGSHTLCSNHMLLRTSFFMVKHEIVVLACQVGPFNVMLTQINSEMNCIAKNKWSESQKLDTRRIGENLNVISHVSRATTCTFIFAFLVFDLFYVRQEKHQKILLSF